MSTAVRLCVACLSFSLLVVDCARRDVDPETSLSMSTEDGQVRCVDITPSLSSCRRLGYRQMRLPSLLNDTANTTSAAVGLIDSCGEDGLVLMCSLLTPVCIDRPIWPCASLCRNVTATCRTASSDVAALIDCDVLPSDDQLCIGPNSSGRKVSYSTETVFDARLQRPQRKRLGRPARTDVASGRRSWKARRASSRRTTRPSSRRTRKWNRQTLVAEAATNTTVVTSCSVCADHLSRGALTERLCNAEFVAKVHPSRYIRAGDSLKLLASKSTKFYKTPKSSASLSSRRRAVFFLHGTSAVYCPCLQAAAVVDRSPRRRRDGGGGGSGRDDGSLLVAGRLDETGGRRRHTRLVVTAALPLSSQALVRRAVRLARTEAVCEQRTERTKDRRSRPGKRRRRRPDRMVSDEQSNGQVAASGGRRDGRKRARQQDGTRRSRKRKPQRNRRGRRPRQN